MNIRISEFLRQIVKTHLIMKAFGIAPDKAARNADAAVQLNGFAEGVVDRLLYKDFFAGLRKRADCTGDRVDDAGSHCIPFALYGKTIAGQKPVLHRVKIRIVRIGIAENAVFCAAFQCIENAVGSPEIHVGDPHGQKICAACPLLLKVVFKTGCFLPADNFVKIAGHFVSSQSRKFYCCYSNKSYKISM